MAYCTQADIEKLIPSDAVTQLTDDEGTGTSVATRVAEAIAQADSDIDALCASRYTVPFPAPAPDIIRKLSVDIAIYNLYSRKLETIPETRAARYKNAVRQLEGINKGNITVNGTTAQEPASGGIKTSSDTANRIFTQDSLGSY